MKNKYEDIMGSERTVEVEFILWCLEKRKNGTFLDVGGIPTKKKYNARIDAFLQENKVSYDICDFRGGKYRGDFVTLNIPEKFDNIIFLSSLEHFPQCTEGDLVFREGEDRKGFLKALSILNEGGQIILTVPFGKPVWQEYHQNYDMEKIKELSENSTLTEAFTYELVGNDWVLTEPENMNEILYTDKAYGVGCFVFEK